MLQGGFEVKKTLFLLLSVLAFKAGAEGVLVPIGADCEMAWDANPISENVDRYKVALDNVSTGTFSTTAETINTNIKCSEIVGLDMNTVGQWYVKVAAHNDSPINGGWSEYSDPPVSFEVVKTVPSTPSAPIITVIVTVTVTVP